MDTLHEACWKTKANKEKAVKDAALAKERAEMRQKVEQTTAAHVLKQRDGLANLTNGVRNRRMRSIHRKNSRVAS